MNAPTSAQARPAPACDFACCKLCGERTAAPLYRLERTTVYGCSECDFHAIDYLDPLPEEQAGREEESRLDRQGWEYIEKRLQAPDPLPALRLQLVREHCPLRGARCLDIGAGVGQFLLLLETAGARACGLEPSGLRREFARRKFGLVLHREMIETFSARPENAGAFDVVTLWDVIEHVNFPAETLAAALHLLKPGGLLFVDTPSRDAAPYRLSQWAYRLVKVPLFLETFYSPLPFGHKQIFRPGQLARLAEQTGFQVMTLSSGYAAGAGLSALLRPRNRIVLICRRPLL